MSRSSWEQTAFLGGEFSPLAQGRSDLPQYKQGMSLSLNGHPVEEGAWVKRSGFEFIVPTRNRTYGRLLPFDGSATCAFGMLFTESNLQFITASGSLVFDNTISAITDSSYSGSSAAEITISPAQAGWAGVNDALSVLGDQVMIVFPDASSNLYPYPLTLEAGLRGRLLTIQTAIDSTHMALGNDLGRTFASDPSLQTAWPAGALVGAYIMRVKNFDIPYETTQQLQNLRAVQIEYQSVILEPSTPPQVVQITTGPVQGPNGADPVFSFGALGMVDGPYFDPSGDTGTLGALTGTTTFVPTTTTPFVASDATGVGRSIRLFTEPAAWASGTAYTPGNLVTDVNGEWWVNVIANTGTMPGQPVLVSGVPQLSWAPAPNAGSWAWARITGFTDSGHIHITFDTTIPGMALQSGNGLVVTSFQLGVYSPSTGYPTCGCLYQGRLLLAGAQANRFDTTISNGVSLGIATFSPTDPYGNVTDSSGMSEIFNSRYVNNIQWMVSSPNGIVMGTLNGEFLVSASQQNDPITPTDIQSWMVTKYGSANIEPLQAGMAIMYVQKYGQKIIEYLADAFSQKYSGRHLDEWSRHLASSGVAELAYQEEPFPCLWARMNNGLLAGWTYRRFNRFVAEPPNIAAGHWHIHGRQRAITSFCMLPGKQGLLERLLTVTNDVTYSGGPSAPPLSNYFVEVLQPFFDQNQVAAQGWLCDEAPGLGPGADPAYDCGGGNKAPFAPQIKVVSDTTTPDTTGIFPYDTNPAPGTDLSANLVLRGASYFDGQTMLYTLPPYPSRGSQADQTSLSMSVWVAHQDAPYVAGALLGSPALSYAEATAQTNIVSTILGGPALSADLPASCLARMSAGIDVYPNAVGQVDDGNGIATDGRQQWLNVLISMKSNSDGTMTVLAYENETLLANNVVAGSLVNNNKAWPFASQPGALKDNGLSVWTIGGVAVADTLYNREDVYSLVSSGPGILPKTLTMAQVLAEFPTARLPAQRFLSDPFHVKGVLPLPPALQVTSFTGSGGLCNVPFAQAVLSYLGWRGSIAELWIKPGTFIDWTNSANRAVMHWHDLTSGTYKPLSLGHTGGGTALGTPWVYLSGPPTLFNLNRANGVRLASLGTGIILSPLQPPFNS